MKNYRTQVFKDSWAHVGKYDHSRYLELPAGARSRDEADVPKLHADYWSMVAEEMKQGTFYKVV